MSAPTQIGRPPRVLVLGAGIAGLAAAVALAEAGLRPTVLERRPVLGGRAASFTGQGVAEPVDNCQHVLLHCCTCLMDFYRRVGVADLIAFHKRVTFIDGRGSHSALSPLPLPAPLHLGLSFLGLKSMGLRDKLSIALGLLRVLRADLASPRLARMTLSAWLAEARQTPRAIQAFWEPVLVSALNESLDRASARYGLMVFRDGFLATRDAYEVGIPSVPLARLYEEPCEGFLASKGGEVRRRATATRLLVNEGQVHGVRLSDGTEEEADVVVSSVPSDALLRILPEELTGEAPFSGLDRLEVSPITAVHLWFDRIVTDLDHAVVLDHQIQWMFNKTRDFGLQGEGSYLGLVVSASRQWTGKTRDEIVEVALREVREVFPAAREAELKSAKVVVEPKATFSATPESDEFRPGTRTPITGLYLAGDWTDTGWPGTMEGAVRSGYLAAEAVLSDLGHPTKLLVPDIRPSGLSRLLMRR
ncbi:MAG TPA: hydroxysqualene dehydroxylase HpnE [Armatimonadota bacterium]